MTCTKRLGASLLLTLCFLAEAFAAPADIDDPVALETFFDGVATTLMKNENSAAGTVAVAKDGELIFARGYGFKDIEHQVPVDPYTTLFRPGSVSKLFTWVAVMQQVEQGNLDLDTDVNEYLEAVEIPATFDQPVTLRHIMTHTAGFEDGALGYLIIKDPAKAVPLQEAMQRYRQERINPPGAQTAYSNYATALAGLIVSNVSGKPFNQVIQDEIFTPLGMSNASFEEPLPGELAEQMAKSYGFEAGAQTEQPFEIIASFGPAGAQSASAVDMVRFAQAILNGGELDGVRILREDTVEEMLSRQFTHDDRLMGMALGFYETDKQGTRVLGHGGDTQWFHSDLGIDAEHNLVYFMSFAGGGGSAVRSSMVSAFYKTFFPREEMPPVPPADFDQRAGRYAGEYGFWRSNFTKLEKAMGLGGGVSVAPGGDGTLVVAFSGDAKRYVEVDDDLFRELDANVSLVPGISPRLIAFQENSAGEVSGFIMDGLPFMSLRKLAPWETRNFNFLFLGLSLVVFALVLLRRFFQRREMREWAQADRSAYRAAVWTSAANWAVLITGVVVISAVQDRLFSEIPLLFKLWLVMPVVAVIAVAWLLVKTIAVWRRGLFRGVGARVRYLVVALCGLFMAWFYWFWNILGWQTLA